MLEGCSPLCPPGGGREQAAVTLQDQMLRVEDVVAFLFFFFSLFSGLVMAILEL